MVKLLKLYANNFKKLKFESTVEFKDGLTLISGLNEAGKSSILDAILYALFARVTRPPGRTRNEDIIAYNTNEAIVILDLEVEGRKYRVTRQIHRTRPSKAKLEEVLPENQLRTLAVEVKRVTDEIEKILGGITFDEIVSSSVVAQKELNRLIELRRDERKKVINVFLNLDSFNVVLSELNEERKEFEGTGFARPGLINIEKDKLTVLREELEESKRRIEEIEKLEADNKMNNANLLDFGKEYDRLKALQEQLGRYDEMLRKKRDLQKELEYAQKELERYSEEVSSSEGQIIDYTKKLEDYAELSLIETSLSRLDPKFDSIREHNAKIRDTSERQKSLSAEILPLQSELKDFDVQKLQRLRQSRKRIGTFASWFVSAFALAFVLFILKQLIPAVVFAVIGVIPLVLFVNSISSTAKLATMEQLASKSELFASKSKDLQSANAQLELSQSQKSVIENEIFSICASIKRYGSILDSLKPRGSMEVATAMKEKAQSERREANKLSDTLQTLKNQLELATQRFDVSSHIQNVEDLKLQLANIVMPPLPPSVEFSSEILKNTMDEKETTGRKISGLTVEIEENRKRMKEDRKYLDEHPNAEANLREQERNVLNIEHRIRVVKRAIEATERTSESLGNRVKPGVERYMAHVLPAITSGRYKAVRLDQDYNLEVWDPEAGEFMSKDVFSGGTEDQMFLAMRLSFAQALLPEVYGRKPEFLFLDEPLGSSDEVRRSGILEFLKTGLRESFKQIFLISHIGGLEEEISNVIKLEDGKVMSAFITG